MAVRVFEILLFVGMVCASIESTRQALDHNGAEFLGDAAGGLLLGFAGLAGLAHTFWKTKCAVVVGKNGDQPTPIAPVAVSPLEHQSDKQICSSVTSFASRTDKIDGAGDLNPSSNFD